MRFITKYPKNGGEPCPKNLMEVSNCEKEGFADNSVPDCEQKGGLCLVQGKLSDPTISSDVLHWLVDCKPSEICEALHERFNRLGYVLKNDLNINGKAHQISIYSFCGSLSK